MATARESPYELARSKDTTCGNSQVCRKNKPGTCLYLKRLIFAKLETRCKKT